MRIGLHEGFWNSFLAIQFLLKPRLTLGTNGTSVQPDSKRPLTTSFRTWLYLAHMAFEAEKRLQNFQRTARLKRIAKHLGDSRSILETAKEAERKIGVAWSKRLKGQRNYAGVSIRDLADSLRILHWYNSVYGIQSSVAHARDAIDHVDFSESTSGEFMLDLGPNCEAVDEPLRVSCALFIGAINIVNTRLGLGLDGQVDDLIARLQEMGRAD
jgi:hypothetical protein